MGLPTLSPAANKQILYSDFTNSFSVSELSNDLVLSKNEQAVKQSIKNLILTERGERLFQPTLGSNIKSTLFELMTPATLKLLEEQVREVINNYEPRAELLKVVVKGLYDQDVVEISVHFYVVNNERVIQLDLILERTR